MEKLTLEELKILESMRKSLRELQKKDLEEVIDFSEELKRNVSTHLMTPFNK
mgnify:CR=1 FL=1